MRKIHKWVGLVFTIFILGFALSGIILNHRQLVSNFNIPRWILPKVYSYKNFNNNAITGSIKQSDNQVILYGSSGVWITDTLMKNVSPLMDGLPNGMDQRGIRAGIKVCNNTYIISPFSLYKLNKDKWEKLSLNLEKNDYFMDITSKEDSLIISSRSYIYSYKDNFTKYKLKQDLEGDNKVSLFRTIWLLHSGEIYGTVGKIVVDFIGFVVILLCITGIILFFAKSRYGKILNNKKRKLWIVSSNKIHNTTGGPLIILLIFICLTGMFLRPPLLISIIKARVPALPMSFLDSKNPWNDQLRKIRYDKNLQSYIIFSSKGLYELKNFSSSPQKLYSTPPIGVMGINVWESNISGGWTIGSFSGLYKWVPYNDTIINLITGKIAEKPKGGRPIFTDYISGYSKDFDIYYDYNKGQFSLNHKNLLKQPNIIAKQPMALWNFCLEVHTGRIYQNFIKGIFNDLYIFISGILILIILISGYVMYYRRRHKNYVINFNKISNFNRKRKV